MSFNLKARTFIFDGGDVPIEEVEPGTDRWAVSQDLVSITPLRLDITDEQCLAEDAKRLGFGPFGKSI